MDGYYYWAIAYIHCTWTCKNLNLYFQVSGALNIGWVRNYLQFYIENLWENCIQSFHLERYIVWYTVGNLVLWRRLCGAVKRDFRTFIWRYNSPNENFEYVNPHSNTLLTFSLQKDSENVLCCAYMPRGSQLHKTACQLHIFTCQPMKSDVTQWRWIPTVYRRYTAENLWRYPIRRRVAFASALEFLFISTCGTRTS